MIVNLNPDDHNNWSHIFSAILSDVKNSPDKSVYVFASVNDADSVCSNQILLVRLQTD